MHPLVDVALTAHEAAVQRHGWNGTVPQLARRDIQLLLYVPTDDETLLLLAELQPPAGQEDTSHAPRI